jgi:hypothetical protein
MWGLRGSRELLVMGNSFIHSTYVTYDAQVLSQTSNIHEKILLSLGELTV